MKTTAFLGSVVCLILLATGALAAPTLTREFTFTPDLLHLDAHNGFTDLRVDGAAPSVDVGMPELPWLSKFVDLPAGMQVASLEIVDAAFEPVAQGVRLESAWAVLPGAS